MRVGDAQHPGVLMLLYGPRSVVTASAVLLIAGLVLSMMMATLWQLWLGRGLLLGVAWGMTSLVLATTIATRWFIARRGLVPGIRGAGTATGQWVVDSRLFSARAGVAVDEFPQDGYRCVT